MLTNFQQSVVEFITEQRDQARQRFHADSDTDIREQIAVAAVYAYALYADFAFRGQTLQMPDILIQNRGVPPTNPEFFYHLHALDALLVAVASRPNNALQRTEAGGEAGSEIDA